MRLLLFASVPALLIGIGTVGYRYLEGWSWFYSFYLAVMTLTSMGHGETTPLSTSGHLFTMSLALGGIFTVASPRPSSSAPSSPASCVTSWGSGARKANRGLGAIIVCGYGHVGQHVCTNLLEAGAPSW